MESQTKMVKEARTEKSLKPGVEEKRGCKGVPGYLRPKKKKEEKEAKDHTTATYSP